MTVTNVTVVNATTITANVNVAPGTTPGGLTLAVEAQEGTDALLRRVAELPADLHGAPARRRGVLAKVAKPIQEERVDLPTIGVATVEGAARAGLAGIVGVAGKMLVIDRAAVAAAADAAGLFVLGVADDG